MRKTLLTVLTGVFTIGIFSGTASAHSQFMKAVKEKYEFRTVSCYTCHSKKSEIAEADLPKWDEEPKQFHNEFGQLFLPLVKGKGFDDRAEKSAELKKAARDADSEAAEEKLKAEAEAIDEAISKDFLEVLEKVEAMKDKDTGKTYAELFKAGEVEGVRLPD